MGWLTNRSALESAVLAKGCIDSLPFVGHSVIVQRSQFTERMMRFFIIWIFLASAFLAAGERKTYAQGSYEISVNEVKVLPTKSNGKLWDVGCLLTRKRYRKLAKRLESKVYSFAHWTSSFVSNGLTPDKPRSCLPDLYAVVKLQGKVVLRTPIRKNKLNPSWTKSTTIRLQKNSLLEVSLFDKDIRSDDLVGSHSIVSMPLKYLLQGGTMTLRFGRVYQLKLNFAPMTLIKPLQVVGSYSVDKASTTLLMQDFIKSMPFQQKQKILDEVQSMTYDLQLTRKSRIFAKIVAKVDGQTINKKIKGVWSIRGYKIALQTLKRAVSRCRFLNPRLICTWWNRPLVLIKKKSLKK